MDKNFTPILLQESKRIITVKVIDEEYYRFEMNFEASVSNPKVIYVKRKYSNNIDKETHEEKQRLK